MAKFFRSTVSLGIFLMLSLTNSRASACGSMPVGFHEFALFGTHSLFLSHYPMFSSIHAYQVIVEVGLKSDDHDVEARYLDHQAAHPSVHYTFSPYRKVTPATDRAKDQDDWVLPDMMKVGNTFNGDIHYSEKGKNVTLDFNVTVEVKKIIELRLLDPKAQRPTSLAYLLFGNGSEAYLSHYITAPPNPGEEVADFDQILTVSVEGSPSAEFPQGPYLVNGRRNASDDRLKKGEAVVLIGAGASSEKVTVNSEIINHSISTQR